MPPAATLPSVSEFEALKSLKINWLKSSAGLRLTGKADAKLLPVKAANAIVVAYRDLIELRFMFVAPRALKPCLIAGGYIAVVRPKLEKCLKNKRLIFDQLLVIFTCVNVVDV